MQRQVCLCIHCTQPGRIIKSSVFGTAPFKMFFTGSENQRVTPEILLSKLLCDVPTGNCYMRRCGLCQDKVRELTDDLLQICLENGINTISFEMWAYSDRTKVEKFECKAEKAVETLLEKIVKLSSHTHEFKQQDKFIRELRSNVPLNSCIASIDFSQNFEFFEADEIQSGHWGKSIGACTLFPCMLRWNDDGILHQKSCCIISDDLEHYAKVGTFFNKKLNK